MTSAPAHSAARAPRERATRGYVLNGQAAVAPTLVAGLHLVATPIGNLRDITVRALEVLAAADVIACEDTRVTRKLLDHYGIATPLTPYHEHNAAAARPKLLARLAEGAAIALVSDAGTPLVSDPGYKLVRAARAQGTTVTAVPGASAVLTALTLSALPTDRFFFEGFLPAKEGQRRARAWTTPPGRSPNGNAGASPRRPRPGWRAIPTIASAISASTPCWWRRAEFRAISPPRSMPAAEAAPGDR
jgi:16S rRNA (cytidine1402-2'-O)-methyltransferase